MADAVETGHLGRGFAARCDTLGDLPALGCIEFLAPAVCTAFGASILKRQDLLQATERLLAAVAARLQRKHRPLRGAATIGIAVGTVLNKHKMAKHFDVVISDTTLAWSRKQDAIADEAALDGFYVIRTNLPAEACSTEQVVLAYKGLSQVERAFRSLKTTDLDIRPIHHRRARRVRGHVLLCMLAYYVTWHMQQALAPMLFTDHDRQTAALQRTSPVAAAPVSPAARAKAATKRTADGQPVHSFATPLADLANLTRKAPQETRRAALPPRPWADWMTIIGIHADSDRALVWADSAVFVGDEIAGHVRKTVVNCRARLAACGAGPRLVLTEADDATRTAADIHDLGELLPGLLRGRVAIAASRAVFGRTTYLAAGWSPRFRRAVGYVFETPEFTAKAMPTFSLPHADDLARGIESAGDLHGILIEQVAALQRAHGCQLTGEIIAAETSRTGVTTRVLLRLGALAPIDADPQPTGASS